jgi:tetratricopeptide (TPR) repeat protein
MYKMNFLLKNTFLILCFSIISTYSFGMERKSPSDSTTKLKDKTAAILLLEEGKASYLEGKYREALNKFRLAYNKDQNNFLCHYWIGLSHLKMNNFGYALQYGKQAEEIKNRSKKDDDETQNVDVVELIASAYHRLDKIDSALIYYTYALNKLPKQRLKDLRIKERMNECNYVLAQRDSGIVSKRKLFSSDINSGYHEYAPILTNNGKTLYFTSRRENTTGGKNNPDDEQYFEDNYRAIWNETDQIWDSITNKLDRINSDGFDCVSHISEDGLTGLMTLNTTATDSKIQTSGSDICEISLSTKGKWSSPKVIKNKTINTSFFDGSATLTADGNTMYFVSDRRGDKSMTDIYEVKKVGKEWGKAVPVSDSINSEMRETTPFITPDGRYLFFSSDGHLGMGGYDIYVSENLGKTWSKPINLGAGINSVNDDTHFRFYPKLNKIIFSSFTLDNLKSSMDIYEIDLKDFSLPIEN